MTLKRRHPARWPEHDLIEREYARRGRHAVAKKIGKDPSTVRAYATRHGLELGDLPGWIRVTEVAHALGIPPSAVWLRADRDQVLRRLRTKGAERAFAAIVPVEWADAFVEERTTRQANTERAQREGWYNIAALTQYWSLGASTILRGLNGQGALPAFLEGIRTMRGHGNTTTGVWWVHPESARTVRDRLNAQRDRAKRMITTKSIAIETGVGQAHAATIGKRLGGELLYVNGRLICHVTPETANIMRARFTTPRAPAPRPRHATSTKQCAICGRAFERRATPANQPGYESPAQYRQRRTCSPTCRKTLAHRNRHGTPT